MEKLIKTGNDIGFSSPKPKTQNVTMYEIAREYNVPLPRKREGAVPILVRARATVRIKQVDANAVNEYTGLKNDSSSK